MFDFFYEICELGGQTVAIVNWALSGAHLIINSLSASPIMGIISDVLDGIPAVFGTMVYIFTAGTVYRFIRGM